MGRMGVGAAALWLGLAVAAAAADPPAAKGEKESSSWWSSLFGSKPKEAPKKAAPRPTTVADKAAEQDRLMRAYLRRLAVCDRLRTVALEANDASLEEQANRLEQMAWQVYSQQSSKLLGVASASLSADDLEAVEAPPREAASALRQAAPGGALPPRLRSGMSPREGDR